MFTCNNTYSILQWQSFNIVKIIVLIEMNCFGTKINLNCIIVNEDMYLIFIPSYWNSTNNLVYKKNDVHLH